MKKDDTLATPPARKKMPAEVFVKIWKGDMEVAGTEWESLVTFWKDLLGTPQMNFSSIEVSEKISVEKNKDLLPHLSLSDCKLSDFHFNNTQIRSVAIQGGSVVGDVVIKGDSKTGDFSIVGNSSIGDFSIENSRTGFFAIQYNSIAKYFLIENAKTGYFEISDNSKLEWITIVNSTIGSFDIWDSSINGEIWVEKSKIGSFDIDNSKILSLYINEGSRLQKMRVWHTMLQRIEASDGSFIGHVECQFILQEPVRLLFKNSICGHLDFDDSVFPEFTTLSVLDCEINRISLNNFCNYGTVFFSGLKPLKKWEDFKKDEDGNIDFNDGEYEFEEINDPEKFPSTLRLTDSDLGKMQFINCDLRQFERFEFSNTKMLEVFVAGSHMPEDKAFCLPNDEQNPIKIVKQKRLTYGQIKKIYEARGNMAGSLRYLAYEMEAYREQLKMEGWWKNRGELFMLWMNKISTNYGTSWQRGLRTTAIGMIVFYSVFCLLLGFVPGTDISKFIKVASFAPQYLNPFRDADSVIPSNYLPFLDVCGNRYDIDEDNNPILPPFARLWDYLSRIFIAYFVYQTIQAFRKLGKSSG